MADATVPVTPLTVNLKKEFVCDAPLKVRRLSRLPLFSSGKLERTKESSVGANESAGPPACQ